jgi:hypothetical protein
MQVNTQSPNRANVVRLLASHGQAGTYPSIRQISTHKRRRAKEYGFTRIVANSAVNKTIS